MITSQPDSTGHFGPYGGRFVPEVLMTPLEELEQAYLALGRLDDAIAIAALYRCLVRLVDRRPDLNRTLTGASRALASENMWRVQRDGVRASLIDEPSGAREPRYPRAHGARRCSSAAEGRQGSGTQPPGRGPEAEAPVSTRNR